MTKRIIIPVVTLGVAALLLFAINGCWNSWEGRAGDQKTDDAYVRADMTPLSTRISGTVRSMDVNDYQPVTQGQLLVQLDDEDYRAKLAEAKQRWRVHRRNWLTTRLRSPSRTPRFRTRRLV